MTLPQLLSGYGYVALFAGSLLEGETIVVLAGFAAHRGYLSLPWVVVIAFFGGAIGDQVFYFIGYRWGDVLLRRLPGLQPSAQRVNRMLLQHPAKLIVGVRFMYGLRIVGPMMIGMSDVTMPRFLTFNLIGAAIWAVAISGLGYLFGQSLRWLLTEVEHYEALAAAGIVLIAMLAAAVRWIARRRKSAK
jgi:membrane protein DedA with SNARE-associated domain